MPGLGQVPDDLQEVVCACDREGLWVDEARSPGQEGHYHGRRGVAEGYQGRHEEEGIVRLVGGSFLGLRHEALEQPLPPAYYLEQLCLLLAVELLGDYAHAGSKVEVGADWERTGIITLWRMRQLGKGGVGGGRKEECVRVFSLVGRIGTVEVEGME